ncbi:AMP-binding protein [Phreatobacter sp. AB_2022a]|uniref:AMP-binding protein n=1 Tax=Phreatobacter sp. AB_2022a TaxID=3003134 RepID=UPI0022872AFE|nr:AMP-binding protein [Phreatobacter sp. AB_2022a]MCZ0733565.1 AMP-binding protein [Phreatobacter sp. AB_2022a]
MTLDGLLRRAAENRPQALALVDAPNRPHIVGGEPRRFDWAGLDAAVDALAGRLRAHSFPIDSVIATQFPLGADGIVALLAVIRAGLVAAPLPLGWGRREIVRHLQRLGARAILTAGRAGPVDCADIMRFAAAEAFSVRFVLSIGAPVLDGVVALDDALLAGVASDRIETPRTGNAADHVALVTADATADGHLAVARSHNQLIAGGLAAYMAGVPDEASVFAATLSIDAFAGIALQIVPWLMSAGALIAHPPFAPRAFADSLAASGTTHAILPAAAAACLFTPAAAAPALRHLTLLTRRPGEIAPALAIRPDGVAADVFFGLGETGIARALTAGAAAGIAAGPDTFATGAGQAPVLIETRRGPAGTLQLRGAMVPASAFPPGAERGQAALSAADDGFVETGMAVAADETARLLVPAGDPAGVVSIGGRRFAEAELRAAYAEAGGEIAPVLRADPVLGQRLAGIVGDGRAMIGLAGRLAETGMTPLGVPGGQRQQPGPLPFEDIRRPEPELRPQPLAETQAKLEQLLGLMRTAAVG